jgi:hypothetical protein
VEISAEALGPRNRKKPFKVCLQKSAVAGPISHSFSVAQSLMPEVGTGQWSAKIWLLILSPFANLA